MAERGYEPQPARSGVGNFQRLWLIVGGWVLVISGIQLYSWHYMLRPLDLLQGLVEFCQMNAVGPLLFLGVAALSPLLLVPAALLGIFAGMCFGPFFGVFYTLIGCNISATLTYSLGRLSPRGEVGEGRLSRLFERYSGQMHRNTIFQVVLLRLSFLPYDPVNYMIGLMRVPWLQFMLANTLGSLPGVVAIVLAGTSVERLDHGLPMINPFVFVGAIGLLLLSLGLAAVLKQRANRAASTTHHS